MKKILSLILCLFILGCSNIDTKKTLPVTSIEKTVHLNNFPMNWEVELENALNANGWEVFALLNSVETTNGNKTFDGQDRATFLIEAGYLKFDSFLWFGNVRVIDLRTGKRIGTSSFNGVTKGVVFDKIKKIIKTIEVVE